MRKSVRIIGLVALLVLLVAAPVDMMAQKRGKAQKRKAKTERTTKGKAASGEQTFTVNGVSFTMIHVQGGTFTMGATSEQGSDASDDEKPAHQVTVSSFSIGQTEVTQELWQAVMDYNPSRFNGTGNPKYGSEIGEDTGTNLKRPVEYVSWDDCQLFMRKLNQLTGKNFRLPTEAEWEYAARGGSKSRGYEYSGGDTLDNVAWYCDNIPSLGTQSVASKSPNELGLYDMSGNVWEWCSDWCSDRYFNENYDSSLSSNSRGPTTGSHPIYRGGSWLYYAYCCSVSYRNCKGLYKERDDDIGFRLAL